MNLYHVKDADRPMFVVAVGWMEAMDAWRAKVREENDGDEGEDPQGIDFVCGADDLILPLERSPTEELGT